MIVRYRGPLNTPLTLSSNDCLWLSRMIVGEGGRKCSRDKARALLWAIMNRWFLWPGSKKRKTFVDLLRAFSQPINPAWGEGGRLAIKFAGKPSTSPDKLKRRKQISTMVVFPMTVMDAVRDFSQGMLEPPVLGVKRKRISNWASLKSTPKNFPWGQDVDGDWFFEDRNLVKGEVTIERIPNEKMV